MENKNLEYADRFCMIIMNIMIRNTVLLLLYKEYEWLLHNKIEQIAFQKYSRILY